MKKNCNINFGKVNKKSVKVFVGDKARKDIEILGSKGSYSVWTDPANKNLSKLRGVTGSLSEVKAQVSKTVCATPTASTASKPPEAPKVTVPKKVA